MTALTEALTSSTAASIMAGLSEAALSMAAKRPWGPPARPSSSGTPRTEPPRSHLPVPALPALVLTEMEVVGHRYQTGWHSHPATGPQPQRPPPRPARRGPAAGSAHTVQAGQGERQGNCHCAVLQRTPCQSLYRLSRPAWASPVTETPEFICKGGN